MIADRGRKRPATSLQSLLWNSWCLRDLVVYQPYCLSHQATKAPSQWLSIYRFSATLYPLCDSAPEKKRLIYLVANRAQRGSQSRGQHRDLRSGFVLTLRRREQRRESQRREFNHKQSILFLRVLRAFAFHISVADIFIANRA